MKPLLLVLLLAAFAAGAQSSRDSNHPNEDVGRPVAKPAATSAQGSSDTSSDGLRTASKSLSAPSAEIVLFGASWCGYCRQARAYLARVGIRYKDVDIDSPEGKAAYAAAGGGGVPLVMAKGEQLRGFSELAYDYFFARLE